MIRAIILASSVVTPKVSSCWGNRKGHTSLLKRNQLLEYTVEKQGLENAPHIRTRCQRQKSIKLGFNHGTHWPWQSCWSLVTATAAARLIANKAPRPKIQ